MIVYDVGIIDYWSGWQMPEQVFNQDDDSGDHTWNRWQELWGTAQNLASDLGWEGDISSGPYVSAVPNKPDEFWECSVLIGWKQFNNGQTFIASERFALPWLADCEQTEG